jgi:L-idonate 5-dehydrogenase
MSKTMLGAVLHGAKDLRVEPWPVPELHHGEVLVRVQRAGICGSDLHYFAHGYCAAFVPTRPFVLGHELVGEVAARAEGVNWPEAGARVVVNPARPCGSCGYCRGGRQNLCARTIMLGSASTRPPTDGAFAHFVAVRADQCQLVPTGMDDALAAMIEPFAVALHAIKRAGTIAGKSVLAMGGGPIGLLVAMSARAFGGLPVVVGDPLAARRDKSLSFAADAVLDPASNACAEQAKELTTDGFDVVFEASGAPAALRQAFSFVRTGGAIVQIGTLGTQDIPLPANELMVREIQLLGSFRYGNVFDEALRLAASGRVNLRPLVSQVLALNEISQAMNLALSKGDVLKVQIQT